MYCICRKKKKKKKVKLHIVNKNCILILTIEELIYIWTSHSLGLLKFNKDQSIMHVDLHLKKQATSFPNFGQYFNRTKHLLI